MDITWVILARSRRTSLPVADTGERYSRSGMMHAIGDDEVSLRLPFVGSGEGTGFCKVGPEAVFFFFLAIFRAVRFTKCEMDDNYAF